MDKILSNPVALVLLCILVGVVLTLGGYVYTGVTGGWENLRIVRQWKGYSRGLQERRYRDVMNNPWVEEDEQLAELAGKVRGLGENDEAGEE